MYLTRENNPAIMDICARPPRVMAPYPEDADALESGDQFYNADALTKNTIRGYQGGIGNSYAWDLMKEFPLFDK